MTRSVAATNFFDDDVMTDALFHDDHAASATMNVDAIATAMMTPVYVTFAVASTSDTYPNVDICAAASAACFTAHAFAAAAFATAHAFASATVAAAHAGTSGACATRGRRRATATARA